VTIQQGRSASICFGAVSWFTCYRLPLSTLRHRARCLALWVTRWHYAARHLDYSRSLSCYPAAMKTKLLDQTLERIENWPADAQDQLADMVLDIDAVLKDVVYEPTDTELQGIDRGLRDVAEGRFATDADIEAAFAKFRRR
jgi:predicted transcriptional regulator